MKKPDLSLRRAVRARLLPWFDQHKREMPWRRRRTAYRVWISELMLQQTRVDQVRPYFDRFMQRFPNLKTLASAPLQEVLKCWEGLGYYTRARNLHKTAQYLMEHHRGRFPDTYEGLLDLPGIGPYTAAAVASLAFHRDHAVLDGNVIRVVSRWLACEGDVRLPATRRALQQQVDGLLIKGDAARFNEAMMELGALVCTPRRPDCGCCPMQRVCAAYQAGEPEAYPHKTRKAKVPHKEVGAAVIVNSKGDVLIAQRQAGAMLGGLWEFPGGGQEPGETMEACVARELKEELGIEIAVGDPLMIVRHAYSHFTIALHVYWARIKKGRPRPIHCADFRWVNISRLRDYPYSRADLHIVERLQQH